MARKMTTWRAVEDLVLELEELQRSKVIDLARRLRPGLTLEDVRNPHDFPELDDVNWMKTTKATFAPDLDEPKFEFEAVDASLIPPRPRKY